MQVLNTAGTLGDSVLRQLGHWWPKLLRFMREKPLGAAGLLIILFLVTVAVFATAIAPYDPLTMDFSVPQHPPSWAHPMGTDTFGRDILSNIIVGARISMGVAFLAVLLGTLIGAAWGLASGYLGGRVDMISQRLIDILQGFPSIVLALLMVASLGPSLQTVIIAISVTLIPVSTRVVRGVAINTKETTYVEAAVAIGASTPRIMLRHVAPNCIAPYIIVVSGSLATAILTEASLGFLGLGVPPPTPTWGQLLSGLGRDALLFAPWVGIFPGVAIFVLVMAFNLFGDALRDVLDPRLRGSK